MRFPKPTPFTFIMLILLIILTIVAITQLTGTLAGYQQLRTELSITPTPTANISSMMLVTFDPNNTPSPTPLLLKVGSESGEVKQLQQKLAELGYYTGAVDGQYGQGTSEAVKLFQAQANLVADGIAGNDTRAALFADAAATYIPTPQPSPAPAELGRGARGDAVRSIQQRLSDLGFYTSTVDGDYGPGTEAALQRFQTQHGLTANGAPNWRRIHL